MGVASDLPESLFIHLAEVTQQEPVSLRNAPLVCFRSAQSGLSQVKGLRGTFRGSLEGDLRKFLKDFPSLMIHDILGDVCKPSAR